MLNRLLHFLSLIYFFDSFFSLCHFHLHCAETSCSKSITINTTRFLASNCNQRLRFIVDVLILHNVHFFSLLPFQRLYELGSAFLGLNRKKKRETKREQKACFRCLHSLINGKTTMSMNERK